MITYEILDYHVGKSYHVLDKITCANIVKRLIMQFEFLPVTYYANSYLRKYDFQKNNDWQALKKYAEFQNCFNLKLEQTSQNDNLIYLLIRNYLHDPSSGINSSRNLVDTKSGSAQKKKTLLADSHHLFQAIITRPKSHRIIRILVIANGIRHVFYFAWTGDRFRPKQRSGTAAHPSWLRSRPWTGFTGFQTQVHR